MPDEFPPPPGSWPDDIPTGSGFGPDPGSKGYTPFGPAAGWLARVGATLVDGFVLILPNAVVNYLAGRALGALIASLLQAAYVIVLLGTGGQTLGNRAAGTRVVGADGRPLNLWRSTIRWASMFLMAVPVIAGLFAGGALVALVAVPLIDDLWPLWDRRNQTLHDKLAGTLVLAGR